MQRRFRKIIWILKFYWINKMINIQLNEKQIIDLLFEKTIICDGIAISQQGSYLSTIYELENRLKNEKHNRRKNTDDSRSSLYEINAIRRSGSR